MSALSQEPFFPFGNVGIHEDTYFQGHSMPWAHENGLGMMNVKSARTQRTVFKFEGFPQAALARYRSLRRYDESSSDGQHILAFGRDPTRLGEDYIAFRGILPRKAQFKIHGDNKTGDLVGTYPMLPTGIRLILNNRQAHGQGGAPLLLGFPNGQVVKCGWLHWHRHHHFTLAVDENMCVVSALLMISAGYDTRHNAQKMEVIKTIARKKGMTGLTAVQVAEASAIGQINNRDYDPAQGRADLRNIALSQGKKKANQGNGFAAAFVPAFQVGEAMRRRRQPTHGATFGPGYQADYAESYAGGFGGQYSNNNLYGTSFEEGRMMGRSQSEPPFSNGHGRMALLPSGEPAYSGFSPGVTSAIMPTPRTVGRHIFRRGKTEMGPVPQVPRVPFMKRSQSESQLRGERNFLGLRKGPSVDSIPPVPPVPQSFRADSSFPVANLSDQLRRPKLKAAKSMGGLFARQKAQSDSSSAHMMPGFNFHKPSLPFMSTAAAAA